MARKRSDIVLSMTLAETFLLLLFLIWLGDVAKNAGQQPPTDPSILKIENARLRAENDRLTSESKKLEGEVRQLRLIVDAFRKAIGIPEPITSPEQVPPAVKAAAEAARRGAPKCAPENLFARVGLRDGITTFTVVASASVAQSVAEQGGVAVPVGSTLSADDDIAKVLRAVSAYSEAHACRFDYTLTYRTKADYYDGRERFERGRLFYAAGVAAESRLPQ